MNKYIGMAVCSWLMGACQNDEMDVMQPQDSEQYTLIGQIDNEYADSRAQIQFGNHMNNVEYFFWNEGDHFTLYQNLNNELVASDFVISENYSEANGGAQSAEFTSTTTLTPSAKYTAVYPCPTTVTDNKVRLELQREIDFTSATTDAARAELWKNYFNNNMFMAASGTVSQTGRNYVQFNHLTSLARITYVNQTGSEQKINSILLQGQNLGLYMSYDLVNNREAGSGSTSGYRFTTTGLTVADKDTVDLYIFFFPKAIEQADLQISINQPTGTKTVSLPSKDILFANGNNQSFRAGMRYWFDLTDTKDGLDWSKNTVSEGKIVIENTELSTALLDILGSYQVKIDSVGNAVMSQQHANQVRTLDFSNKDYTITSLVGIENFVNLESLSCDSYWLAECDLSKNVALRSLNLSSENLKVLNLSANENLSEISLMCGKITSLTLGNTSKLEILSLGYCRELTSLNISDMSALRKLDFSHTGLNLSLSNSPNLTYIGCSYSKLTELDIPQTVKSQLTHLDCNGLGLSALDLSEYPNLVQFYCMDNNITSLDLSKSPNINMFTCDYNNIEFLDVTPLGDNLSLLVCGDQKNGIVLELKLTDSQKSKWESSWSTTPRNKNVVLYGGVTDNSGSGNDFNNGGEF